MPLWHSRLRRAAASPTDKSQGDGALPAVASEKPFCPHLLSCYALFQDGRCKGSRGLSQSERARFTRMPILKITKTKLERRRHKPLRCRMATLRVPQFSFWENNLERTGSPGRENSGQDAFHGILTPGGLHDENCCSAWERGDEPTIATGAFWKDGVCEKPCQVSR